MRLTTILIGLNDKDAKCQIISTKDARDIVAGAFSTRCEGATISDALGVYTHEDGQQVIEKSIRVEIFNGDDSRVREAVAIVKKALNQEAVIYSNVETNTEFI